MDVYTILYSVVHCKFLVTPSVNEDAVLLRFKPQICSYCGLCNAASTQKVCKSQPCANSIALLATTNVMGAHMHMVI